MTTRKRQLAAIMFTDIVGFSAMMQVDEEKATVVRNRHRQVFRDLHDKHGGKILQYYGDGTLSIFDSAVSAVECAVEMQEAFRRDPKVPLRIGIHTGDITYEEEGAFGDGLNIAARIEPLCTPGGVFISSKVYDDIKNHPWLRARSLGPQKLKNILTDIEVYAVTSRDLPAPDPEQEQPRQQPQPRAYPQSRPLPPVREPAPAEPLPLGNLLQSLDIDLSGEKKRKVAALLALFLGMFGAHRFYLGQRKKGITYLVFAIIGLLSANGGGSPFLPIMAIIGVIDAVLLFSMSDEEFDRRYNQQASEAKAPAYAREKVYRREQEPGLSNPYKRSGVRKFRSGDYNGAMADFQKALEQTPTDMAVHFNLACCYSLLRKTEPALSHLNKAIENGFWDFEKIHQHEALEFVRNTEGFTRFVANDYRLVSELPPPQKDLLETEPQEPDLLSTKPKEPDLLDQIANLGDMMERGVITREEFDEQKRKLLSGE